MAWDKRQAKLFLKSVPKSLDLNDDLVRLTKDALIAQKVLNVVLMQDRDTVKIEDVRELYRTMLEMAGAY